MVELWHKLPVVAKVLTKTTFNCCLCDTSIHTWRFWGTATQNSSKTPCPRVRGLSRGSSMQGWLAKRGPPEYHMAQKKNPIQAAYHRLPMVLTLWPWWSDGVCVDMTELLHYVPYILYTPVVLSMSVIPWQWPCCSPHCLLLILNATAVNQITSSPPHGVTVGALLMRCMSPLWDKRLPLTLSHTKTS